MGLKHTTPKSKTLDQWMQETVDTFPPFLPLNGLS